MEVYLACQQLLKESLMTILKRSFNHSGRIIYEYNYSNAYRDEIITKFELINVYAPMFEHEEENMRKLATKYLSASQFGQFDKTDKALRRFSSNVPGLLKIAHKNTSH